jgi:hypothetical protein
MSAGMLRRVVWRNDQRFKGAYCLLSSRNEGGECLWNAGQFFRHYMTQHPRRQVILYSPPWKPELSPHEQIPKDK